MRCSETTRVLTYALHRSGPSDPIRRRPSAVRCRALRSCFHVCLRRRKRVGSHRGRALHCSHCYRVTAHPRGRTYAALAQMRSSDGSCALEGERRERLCLGSPSELPNAVRMRACHIQRCTHTDARRGGAYAQGNRFERSSQCERQLLRALHCIGIGFSTTRLVRDLNAKHRRVSRLLQHHLPPQWRVSAERCEPIPLTYRPTHRQSHLSVGGQCIGNPT